MNKTKDCLNLLIYPSFADPTQPYVSLPTLKGYLHAESIPVRVEDWNIDGLHYLLTKSDQINILFKKKKAALSKKKNKTLAEKIQFLRIQEIPTTRTQWPNVLTSKQKFFSEKCYSKSRHDIENLFKKLSILHFPFEFELEKASIFLTAWSPQAIDHYINNKNSPLLEFYKNKIKTLAKNKIGYIGLSLTFNSQLIETLVICALVKKLIPSATIVLGGAALHQLVSHLTTDEKKYLFNFADILCLYEGEETLKELTKLMPLKKKNKAALHQVPNILFTENNLLVQTPIKVVNLSTTPAPDYSDLLLKKYLAPSPILLYAPTRGCYWNKCSFCYYGFSQAQTHCYREKDPKTAAKEMISLSKKFRIKNFYLSGDVLSPRFALELAKELKKSKRKIYWGTDLRIEKFYTPERCKTLYAGGLRAVAFGIESGSNQMLKNVINKGMEQENATEVNQNFFQAKIATAWMTFLHHPKETFQDALATLNWIREQQNYISLFIIGEFGLTGGSKIYANASSYNLKKIFYTEGDFFKLFPQFEETTKNSSSHFRQELSTIINEIEGNFNLSHYPWAGSISTHHSFLYFLKFGQNAFKTPPVDSPHSSNHRSLINEKEEIEYKIHYFLQKNLKPLKVGKKLIAPLNFQIVQNFLAKK